MTFMINLQDCAGINQVRKIRISIPGRESSIHKNTGKDKSSGDLESSLCVPEGSLIT